MISEEEQAELVLGYVVNQEVRALEAEQAAAAEKKLAEDEARRKANAEPVDQPGGNPVEELTSETRTDPDPDSSQI